ncbi:hypothetical protein [Enterococcus gallinarum]|uniref:hypothetical protein n=1 Tax=Enterococcus gallinarum TaxID=1353 RepID=UPI0027DEFC4C|nr:hypothetical protein [Enterococcus gallinarum]MDQ6112790.1 hypothetical protein [Enterococcus gallinarum]
MKRILNYPGSKWTLAEKTVDLFPEHVTYVEHWYIDENCVEEYKPTVSGSRYRRKQIHEVVPKRDRRKPKTPRNGNRGDYLWP